MFEDPDFRASEDSIGQEVIALLGGRQIVWLRPPETAGSSNPVLFKENVSPSDVLQGSLGDCFLVSALALLTSQLRLLKSLIRPSKRQNGCYTVRLWEFGQDTSVIVDDMIPCCASRRLPIFARCRDPDQFWVQLVEKAVAKCKGCYSFLVGGHICECLHTFTGQCIHAVLRQQHFA